MPAGKSTNEDERRQKPPDRPSRASPRQPARLASANKPSDQPLSRPAFDTSGYLGKSAPVDSAPPFRRVNYVHTAAGLAAIIHSFAQARVIGVDAEFAQPHLKHPDEPPLRLSVVQLASDADPLHVYVIDALQIADLTPLSVLFEDTAVLKLFHGASTDDRVLAARGLHARHTLDLEAVCRSIFGHRETGLRAMLHRAYGIRLDKSLQRADWLRRPLTHAMIAYAGRDAEMTLALYVWLQKHYAWAVALHERWDTPPPDVAAWIAPFLDGARPQPTARAVEEAGIAGDKLAQERDLRHALGTVENPGQRARVIRMVVDLELRRLARTLHRFLASPAADERAGAVRALGRLHDQSAVEQVRALSHDDVQDVRQAVTVALDLLEGAAPRVTRRAQPNGESAPAQWTSGESSGLDADVGSWQHRLRTKFGLVSPHSDAPDETDH